LEAADIIETLGLEPHPEGGYFRETWRHAPAAGGRGAGTAIYFLLTRERVSRWHRVDAAEIWHFYAGAPLALSLSVDGNAVEEVVLGSDLVAGERPQRLVPPGAWQSARTLGAFTLVGCTVSPAFEFQRFELAPDGWTPGATRGR
jgi:hypothetical protein